MKDALGTISENLDWVLTFLFAYFWKGNSEIGFTASGVGTRHQF